MADPVGTFEKPENYAGAVRECVHNQIRTNAFCRDDKFPRYSLAPLSLAAKQNKWMIDLCSTIKSTIHFTD